MSVKLESAGLDRSKKVVEIANLNPIYCRERDSISNIIDKMISTGRRRLPIVSRKQELVGISTMPDMLDAFLRKQDFRESISTIMVRDVIFCNAEDNIGFVLQKFKISRRGGFPIIQDKKLIGMVTERDYVKRFSDVNFGMKVKELMTAKPFFIPSNISIFDCLKTMVNTHYRRLPIVQDGKLTGIISSADLLNYIKRHNYNFDDLDESTDSIIIKDVITISKEKDVSDVIKLMEARDVGGILVVEGDRLEGIITERDILEEIV